MSIQLLKNPHPPHAPSNIERSIVHALDPVVLADGVMRSVASQNDTSDQVEMLNVLGRRIAADLRRLLSSWPAYNDRMRALAAYLDVDRNVCQRAYAASRTHIEGLDVLAKLPGLKPLRGLIAVAEKKNANRQAVAALNTLLTKLEDVIADLGGRQSDLRSFIEHAQVALRHGGDAKEIEHRRACYEHAAELLGIRIDVHYVGGFLWTHPQDPRLAEYASFRSFVRVQRRAGGPPIVSSAFRQASEDIASETHSHEVEDVPESTLGYGASMLRSFCDPPDMTVSGHIGPNAASTVVIETPSGPASPPATVAIGSRMTPIIHPLTKPGDQNHNISRIMRPTRRLVLDAYLERSLAMRCTPRIYAVLANPAGLVQPADHWYESVPCNARLERLSDDFAATRIDEYPQSAELSSYFFRRLGLRREDFVGYRIDVPYPLLNALYMTSFDLVDAGDTPDVTS